jgi:hypothetical protein
MEQILDPQFYVTQLEAARDWLAANALLLSVSTISQLIVVVAAFLAAQHVAPRAQAVVERVTQGHRYESQLRRFAAALAPLTLPIVWLLLLWLSVMVAVQAGVTHPIITIVVSLLTAWVVIRLSASLVRDPVGDTTGVNYGEPCLLDPPHTPHDGARGASLVDQCLLLPRIIGRVHIGNALRSHPVKLKHSILGEPGVMRHALGNE